MDGTGYGPDGTVWGGEFLLADRLGFERLAHFKTYPLPGGERAIEEPWRMALSVALAEDLPWRPDGGGPMAAAADVERLLAAAVNCPLTTSAGRLFDAVAAMLDLCLVAGYEAQAAIRLEAIADKAAGEPYPYLVGRDTAPWVLDFGPALRRLMEDKVSGVEVGAMSARFHATVAAGAAEVCAGLCDLRGLRDVALSGGVFQNRILLEGVTERLGDAGLTVYSNSLVPTNDGGVSLGQAAVAVARLAEGVGACA